MDRFRSLHGGQRLSPWLVPAVWLVFALYAAAIALSTGYAIARHRDQVMAGIDRSLLVGTSLVTEVLPRDFHDRANREGGITAAEDAAVIAALTRVAAADGFHYLYAYVLDGDLVRLTTSSATSEELAEHSEIHHWQEYKEAPAAARAAITDPAGGPRTSTYNDRWGTFRSVFVPKRSPGGVAYAVGADYALDEVEAQIGQSTVTSLAVAGVLILAGLMLVAVIAATLRRLRRAHQGLEVLAQVAQATGHGVAIFDRGHRLRWRNEGFVRHGGGGDSLATVLPEADERISGALASGSGITVETAGRDGRWLLADLRPVGGEGGWILMLHDLTERKRLEEDLRHARTAAESATEAKSRFLANMSHELRTPMNGVLGMTELLIGSGLTPEQEANARTVQRSAEALLTLLNDILDLSKVEAGMMTVEATPTDVIQVVHDVADLLRIKAAPGKVELLVHIQPGLAPGALTDPLRLRQVLCNLVGNALKFTTQGHVLIDVAAAADPDHVGVRRWTIAVADTGMGIPADRLHALFKPFSQADETIARQFGGTGLGLSISRHLVGLLGGTLSVASTAGKGSVFTISLTLGDGQLPSPAMPPLTQLAGVRVLVVDGTEVNRRILLEQLAAVGMECVAVDTATLALAELRAAAGTRRPFALVICDHHCDGLDAPSLARAIHADSALPDPALVLYTSVPVHDSAAWLAANGFAGYLLKPARAAVLFTVLGNALEDAGLAGSPSGIHLPGQTTRHTTVAVPAMVGGASGARAGAFPGMGSSGTRTAIRARRLRVLVADDNTVNLLVARKMLEWLGCETACVEDGEQALALWRPGRWDVVLMDCQMPVLDGFAATARIRAQEAGATPAGRVPIIALTANIDATDRDACIAAGMDDHLPKPLTFDGLARVLQRWIPS